MHSQVNLVEERWSGCHASWVTLEVLDCNGEAFRRKYMEPTGDPALAWALKEAETSSINARKGISLKTITVKVQET